MRANERAFETLKRLEGKWEGASTDGKSIQLTYQIASKNSIVIEFYNHFYKGQKMEDEMVTVYHLNGDELMLTHYCTLGNQPRMIADLTQEQSDTLQFNYVNATNLPHTDCLRMSGVTFHFEGDDRFKQTWYWCGKKAYIAPHNRSDDYDEIADDGLGKDTFTFVRAS